MSLQMRMSSNDPRLHDPNRDLAHNFHFAVRKVAARLEDNHWEAVGKYLKERGITSDQLGEAMKAYILFVATTTQDKKEDVPDALERSGWMKIPEPAQVAVMAYLGTVMTGMYFVGCREATIGGQGPCSDVRELVEAGDRIARLLSGSRLRRIWNSVRKWAREKLRARPSAHS